MPTALETIAAARMAEDNSTVLDRPASKTPRFDAQRDTARERQPLAEIPVAGAAL